MFGSKAAAPVAVGVVCFCLGGALVSQFAVRPGQFRLRINLDAAYESIDKLQRRNERLRVQLAVADAALKVSGAADAHDGTAAGRNASYGHPPM